MARRSQGSLVTGTGNPGGGIRRPGAGMMGNGGSVGPLQGNGGDPFIKNVITARTGRFNLFGDFMNSVVYYGLAADAGAFAVSGQAINMIKGRSVVADRGVFTFTGIDAGLIRATPGAYTLASASGPFIVTGMPAALVKATPPSYTGPGDRSAGWSIWGGLRAFSAAYAAPGTNPALDLVDQAGANPYTAKILNSGDLDMAGIAAWVSAKSVTTAKVAKLYDQTGGGNHWVQATLANMPDFLLNQVGTRPGLRFYTGPSTALITPSASATLAQPFSISLVGKTQGASGGVSFKIFTSQGSFNAIFNGNSPNQWEAYNGPNPPFPANDNAAHGVVVVFNGTSSSAYTEAGLTNFTLNTGSATGAVGVGAGPGANFNLEGNVFEVGYNSNDLTGVQAALVADQKAYWGF